MPRTHVPTRPKKDELIESITRLREEVFQATWSGWCDQWMHLDLTLAQLKALFRLYAVPPARMSELASALGVSLPSCTSLVDRLVQQGMVERRQDADDRRLVLCELSAQGHDLVGRLWDSGQLQTRDVLERLTEDELRIVAQAMTVFRRALIDAEAPNAAREPSKTTP